MKAYLPIQWHTGMLMLAQHFQQDAKYKLFQLQQIVDSFNPFVYGVWDYKYTYENDVLTITQFKGLMPNLLPIIIEEENDCVNLDLSTLIANENNVSSLESGVKYKVYLSVPEEDLLEQSIQSPIAVGPITDDFDNENKEMVIKLKPNLRLIVDKTSPAKHHSIPLFEITYSNNQFVFGEFEPISLRFKTDSAILMKLEKLKQTMRNKLFYLKIQDQWSDANLKGIKIALLNNLLVFEQQLQLNSHPYHTFKELLRIASSVACLSIEGAPSFTYNHDEQTSSFNVCIDYINQVLNEVKEQYARFELVQDGNMLKIPLKNLTLCTEHNRKYFILSANMLQNYEVLDDWIVSCVIATDSIYDSALQNRVLGAKRNIVDYVDHIHGRSNKSNLFFYVEYDPTFINLQDEFLIIYNDKDTKDTPSALFGYVVE